MRIVTKADSKAIFASSESGARDRMEDSREMGKRINGGIIINKAFG